MNIRVSIVGVTGYTGRELLSILLKHPHVKITHCTSESSPNQPVSSIHPSVIGSMKHEIITEKCSANMVAQDTDCAFLCLPHAQSAKMAKQFLDKRVKVIDLSADFRLKSSQIYRKWYGEKHPHPELLKKAVYGLPEIHRDKIKNAGLIANPGCYATASILSALPIVKKNFVDPRSVIIDAKSGVSGAGKKLENRYLFCETNENFLAYAVAHHRHSPEIEQELSLAGKKTVKISFVPHLLPVNRGILVTLYASLKRKISTSALWKIYADFYEKEPFVVLLPERKFPELKSVQHTNVCQIGVRVDEPNKRAIVIAVIDNLGKGASSQAVQNMNLMFGLEERCGLC